jgi:hypothetical protein
MDIKKLENLKKKQGRPKGSKNKPKVYAESVHSVVGIPESVIHGKEEGKGIKLKIYRKKGKGIALPPLVFRKRVIKHKKVFNNKYAIDIKKLKKNILDLKYLKNTNHVATFQPIQISAHLKTIVDKIIADNYNVQEDEFETLNNTEKRILKRLMKFLKINIAFIDTYDMNHIQNNFEIAYGSFLAGNTNKDLIEELKEYILLALHEGTINKKDGMKILTKLNK